MEALKLVITMSKINKNSVYTEHIDLISDDSLSFSTLSTSEEDQLSLLGNLDLAANANVVYGVWANDSIPITGRDVGKNTIIRVDKMMAAYHTMHPHSYGKINGSSYHCMGIFETKYFFTGYWYMIQAFITQTNIGSTGTDGLLISGIFCYDNSLTGPHTAWVIHNNYHSDDYTYSIRIYPLNDNGEKITNWSEASKLGFYIFGHLSWEGLIEVPAGLHFIRAREIPLKFLPGSIK